MKKTILLFAAFITAFTSFSQTYSFQATTGTYADLASPVSLNNGLTWDDPLFLIPVGFEFNYFGDNYDTVYISNVGLGGFIGFEHGGPDNFPLMVPFSADLVDRASTSQNWEGQSGSLSPLSYKTEGAAGNRILKIEWKNAGFYGDVDDDDISTDYVNFQLWIYEQNNNIEMHYGPVSVTQPDLAYDGESGPAVVLSSHLDLNTYELDPQSIFLTGNPSSPDTVMSADFQLLNGTIPNGTIYRFIFQAPASVNEVNMNASVSVFPNPANNRITVFSDNRELNVNNFDITNAFGQTVKTVAGTNTADVSELAAGVYFVKAVTRSGVINKQFIKN